jgi:PAS domain S-box-containing protein
LKQLRRLSGLIETIWRRLSWIRQSEFWRRLPSAPMIVLLLAAGASALAALALHVSWGSVVSFSLKEPMYALAWLVSLVGIYTLFRQIEFQRMRRRLVERDTLFQLITEHAADMIAVVDVNGKRLYNSPSYQTILGYSPSELEGSWAFEQIHPDDREEILTAARQARRTGVGQRMEYRVRHKDGSWRVLESTASAIRNAKGEVEKFVIVNRDITDRKQVEQRLEHSAYHDVLTDLPNRNLFLDCLQRAFERTKKNPHYKFAVLFVDIDGFKAFNDSMGHSVGDQLIIEIARRLTRSLRYDDTVSRPTAARSASATAIDGVLARLGGDEFTILVGGIEHPGDALRVAQRIQQELSVPIALNGQEVFTSASIGIALSMTPHSSAADMLRDADIAMYRAKALGKARSEIFDAEMHARAVKRLKLETDLHKALDRNELEVYYQPIVRLQTGRIIGFEALVRWNHPEDGFLLPDSFIPMAEETGLIIPMNQWVLRESCRTVRSWHLQQRPSEPPLLITVNVSAKQLGYGNLLRDVDTVLQDTGLSPDSLHLEVTESIAMSDPEGALQILSRLKNLGVRISIDDFGTGYSSLSRLRQCPADVLKVDRSFVARIKSGNDEDCEIVRLITMLAHSLHLQVVAEGIETKDQLDFLLSLGCELGQGYLFSRPVDHHTAQSLLEHGFPSSPTLADAARGGA